MNIPFKEEWNRPPEIPDLARRDEELSCNLEPEYTSKINKKDVETPSPDMREVLTRAVEMIKRWA